MAGVKNTKTPAREGIQLAKYGYRFEEVNLVPNKLIKPHVVISIKVPFGIPQIELGQNTRPVEEVSLGMHVKGISLPHPDHTDPLTVLHGLLKRVAIEPPPINMGRYEDIRDRFMPRLITTLFPNPLDIWTDFSSRTWLAETTYELWRVQQLLATEEKMNGILDSEFNIHEKTIARWFSVDGFIKDECYTDLKHARGINARKDTAKIFFGPIFKAIEKVVFRLKFFIKKIPKAERAKFLLDFINDPASFFASTDFSSFESCFRKIVMELFERPLYAHFLKDTPIEKLFLAIYDHFILGINHIFFKYFKVDIEATRMTGEMNTSLGNGWTNLCLMLYVLEQSGYDIWTDLMNFPISVEGDDGLTRVDPVKKMKDEIFKELGFVVKIDYFPKVSLASFCGNVFDPDDLVIIPDIRKALASFGWSRARYRFSKFSKKISLLRAKAFSLLYEYPGCPILQSLAVKTLDLTKGYRMKPDIKNDYERYFFNQMICYVKEHYGGKLPIREVPKNTRLLVEELYNIPIHVQLTLEEYFDNLTTIEPLSHPFLEMIMPQLWSEYDYNYVKPFDREFDNFFWKHEFESIPWTENFVTDVYKKYGIMKPGIGPTSPLRPAWALSTT